MRILFIVLVVITALQAEKTGPYLSIAYGAAFYDNDERLSDANSKIEDGSIRFTLGAYINDNFSLELDYTLYKKFYGTYESGEVKESFSTVGISALAHWPFYNDKFDLYGKFGAGQISWNETGSHSNDDASGAYIFGVGVGYAIAPDYIVKIGYDLTSFGLEDTNKNQDYSMRLDYIYTALEVKF